LRRMAMLGAYLLLAAVVTFAWANEWLDSRRSLGLYGTILGLLPGALHSRVSSRASAPARHWRYCAAAFILIVGFFVAIYPFSANSAWHSFLEDPSQSRFVLRWVDCISCCGITMVAALCVKLKHPPSNYIRHAVWAVCGSWLLIVLLCSTVFFPQKYHPLLQHWAWHLEGIDFTWIAWLMTDRIIALADTSSITMQRSGTIISLAAICFHLRIITETIFELTPFSLALQMVLASTFLLLWIFLCVRIAVCLGGSLWLLRKELPFVEGAPRVEADWAMTVVRLELLACVLITFSCTTLWWLPYKALSWAESPEVADQMLLIPVVVAHRFNHLIKAVSVAMLSGLLWPCASVPHHDDQPRAAPSVSFRLGDPDLWTAKVKELANRGFTVQCLLRFWRSLLEDKVMPTFNPLVSTTNDVVRLAIIPMSRDAETGGGRALAEIWSGGKDVPAQCMVTHNWSNLFLHTVAAVFADALKEEFYAGVANSLLDLEGVHRLEQCLEEHASKTYWVCAFSINQHSCICDDFGKAPTASLEFEEWDLKRRDSTTGLVFPVCPCQQRKFFNGEPAECEMNKFDAMMRHLSRGSEHFAHLVVADTLFNVFTRAWCIAEIVESKRSGIKQRIKLHSATALDQNYGWLRYIDVRNCKASRPEDREMILENITDVAKFNSDLQWTIFGTEGLLHWMDGPGRIRQVQRIVKRAGTFGGRGRLRSGSDLEGHDGQSHSSV